MFLPPRQRTEQTGIPVPDELDRPLEVPQINMAHAMDNYYRRMKEESSKRSYGIHITNAVSDYGSKCDLSLQMQVRHEPTDGISWAPLYRRFNIGHGFHDAVYMVIEQAFELEYGGEWAGEWHIEQGLKFPGTLLTGTPDAVLTMWRKGRREEGIVRLVIDVKTVSTSAMEKYRNSRGGITVPLQYRKQVQSYVERLKASAGLILWVLVEKPWPFLHSWIQPNAKVLRALETRAIRAAEAEEEGRLLIPNVGGWCGNCPYRSVCQQLTGAHND